jgi:signal transduction histidine kinase
MRRRMQRTLAQPDPTGADSRATLTNLMPLLQLADDQTARLGRMIADLLDVARIQSDQMELHETLVDLVQLVERCVDEVRLGWPERQVRLEAPNIVLQVRVDADRIGQVVINYLTNALKYSPPTASVVISVHVQDDGARVQVQDQGPGLSPEQQQAVWDRYKRVQGVPVQDDPRASGGGLGLGLYISRMIIRQHGGEVGVESAPGQGATFWFTLPLST